ncbi:hypothetical protein GCM10029964_070050 [Kibdelosporangium lantanae]
MEAGGTVEELGVDGGADADTREFRVDLPGQIAPGRDRLRRRPRDEVLGIRQPLDRERVSHEGSARPCRVPAFPTDPRHERGIPRWGLLGVDGHPLGHARGPGREHQDAHAPDAGAQRRPQFTQHVEIERQAQEHGDDAVPLRVGGVAEHVVEHGQHAKAFRGRDVPIGPELVAQRDDPHPTR